MASLRSVMLTPTTTSLAVNQSDPDLLAICDVKSVFGCSRPDGQLPLLEPQLQHLLCLSALLTHVPICGPCNTPHQSRVGPHQANTSGAFTKGADWPTWGGVWGSCRWRKDRVWVLQRLWRGQKEEVCSGKVRPWAWTSKPQVNS